MRQERTGFLKISVTVLSSLILMISCKKESNNPGTVDPGDKGAISRIEYSDHSTHVTYNTDGTIKTMEAQEADGDLLMAYGFNYAAGKLANVVAGENKWIYTYTDSNVSKADFLGPDGDTVQSYDYIYDGVRLKEQLISFDFGEGLQLYYKLAFTYDGRGNVIKTAYMDYYPDTESWEETGEIVISDYDDKPNLHALLESYPYIPLSSFSPNNPGKERHYNEGGTMVETITHTYTYDTQGRPVTRTSVSNITGGEEETELTKFYY